MRSRNCKEVSFHVFVRRRGDRHSLDPFPHSSICFVPGPGSGAGNSDVDRTRPPHRGHAVTQTFTEPVPVGGSEYSYIGCGDRAHAPHSHGNRLRRPPEFLKCTSFFRPVRPDHPLQHHTETCWELKATGPLRPSEGETGQGPSAV